jgi:hypothetical protein
MSRRSTPDELKKIARRRTAPPPTIVKGMKYNINIVMGKAK